MHLLSLRRSSVLFLYVLLVFHSTAFAETWVRFDPSLPAGSRCVVDVTLLHPTQCSLGLKEVELRASKLRKLDSDKLAEYLGKRIAPIVIGPGGAVYLLDHHHLARAILLSGVKKTLYAEVKENWSGLPEDQFWAKMQERRWVYLYDEAGKGPLTPSHLPQTIEAMRDDPYRTLAWLVREKGGYRETSEPYAEFAWANFLRTRIQLGQDHSNYDQAEKAALDLAHAPGAKDLPGYIAITNKDARP